MKKYVKSEANTVRANRRTTFYLTACVVAVSVGGVVKLTRGIDPLSPLPEYKHSHDTIRPSAKSRTASGNANRYIVQFEPNCLRHSTLSAIAHAGGIIGHKLPIINAIRVMIPRAEDVARVGDVPGVRHISPDLMVRKTDEFLVEHTFADVAAAPTRSGGYGLSGQGVGVAVLDSGIKVNSDLTNTGLLGTGLLQSSRLVAAVDFVASRQSNGAPQVVSSAGNDPLGHGTHVAGIIAGNGANSDPLTCYRTFYGMARRANLVSIRVLDENGTGSVSQVIEGINWAVQNKARYNIRVLNVSLGHPVVESALYDPLNQAVEAAWKAGIVVVCSAGNSGRATNLQTTGKENEGFGTNYGSIQCPGNDPYVITVGATKYDPANAKYRTYDRIATYSSRGPTRVDMILKPDIVAPGNQIISVAATDSALYDIHSPNIVPTNAYQLLGSKNASRQYFVLSGTSMAAPVVSGAAALLLEKYPTLTPDTVKARLMVSATKWRYLDRRIDPLTFGAGYLNVVDALTSTLTVPPNHYAFSPVVVATKDGYLYVDMTQAIWGGTSNIGSFWYTGSVTDLQAIWGGTSTKCFNFFPDDPELSSRALSVQNDHTTRPEASSSGVDLSALTIFGE